MASMKKHIIYVPGTFDLWHVGHIRIFKFAKNLFSNTYVIAGISTDSLIKKYKHIKPVYPLKERIETVSACKYVDKIIVQKEFFKIKQLIKENITCILLGSDWKGKSFPELENAVKKAGFIVIYKPYTKEVSSSEIKKRIIKSAYEIVEAQTQRKHG